MKKIKYLPNNKLYYLLVELSLEWKSYYLPNLFYIIILLSDFIKLLLRSRYIDGAF